jgi:hypothetical protein
MLFVTRIDRPQPTKRTHKLVCDVLITQSCPDFTQACLDFTQSCLSPLTPDRVWTQAQANEGTISIDTSRIGGPFIAQRPVLPYLHYKQARGALFSSY